MMTEKLLQKNSKNFKNESLGDFNLIRQICATGVLKLSPVLHCIALHCTALHCIVLYCFIVLYCIVLYCIVLYCIGDKDHIYQTDMCHWRLKVITCIALHWTALHCIALHCIALYCIVLLYCFIVLYCIVLYWRQGPYLSDRYVPLAS